MVFFEPFPPAAEGRKNVQSQQIPQSTKRSSDANTIF